MNEYESNKATKILQMPIEIEGMTIQPESLPLFSTSAFSADSMEEMKAIYQNSGYAYIRFRSPNREILENYISVIERTEKSLCLASGMAAITSTIFSNITAGDKIICSYHVYGETLEFFEYLENNYHVAIEFIDLTNYDAVVASITENTKLIYAETIGNPTMIVPDFVKLSKLAKQNNILLIVDNTFATGIASTPSEYGADIVINSLTKFINGHSDSIGGSVSGNKYLIDNIKKVSSFIGTPLDPYNSWTISKHILSLDLRMNKQMENAKMLALFLKNHKKVKTVNYPLFSKLPVESMRCIFPSDKYGAMLSFEIDEDLKKIERFMKALVNIRYAPTLGGIRTTMAHPVTSSHGNVPDEKRRMMGITPGLIRISVGAEDIDALINEFEQAFKIL
ncbi:MAG: aminotransferase class I/II-fold pyridoxal phosphate-dependent enzyme [Streptococcaceae bacterium]|jgi:cystathionine gamma-synthase|nr:aminotransferase class I/II-fold pyridoxal phosphate-dependent enzyme [Streptococcaceae bacterium]MCH4178065.1 aminotransferase class I/II-fold pyridoxal phosphate-dependent enzyme [Streptococcaceae bacterium]